MLARLVVNLTAQYGGLVSGLKAAQNSVGSTVRSIRSAMGSVAGQVAGLVSAGAAVGLVYDQMQKLDKVADVGARTGFGSESIIGLGNAAQLSGSSVDTLQAGLGKFSIIMGQAAAGTGSGVEGLKRLGLSFSELNNLSPDQQLLKVSEAMRQLPNEAERNAVAVQLFGKSGAELAPMLAQGEAGLKSFIDQAKQSGAAFSQGELDKIAEANDAIDQLKMTMSAAIGSLAVAVAPVITSVVSGLQSWIESLGGVTSAVETVGGWWTWLQNTITDELVLVMAFGQFVWQNLSNIAELAIKATALGFVSMSGQIVHFFSGVMPALLTWFGNNWQGVFFTIFDFASTVFINLGKNIRAVMTAIWDYIKSGGTASLEVAWTPLTDGFVNAVKELPDIPERVVGPLEQELQARVTELGTTVSDSFGQIMAENFGALDEMRAQAEQKTQAVPKVASLGAGAQPENGVSGSGSGNEDKSFSPLLKGSADAYKAIVAAMGGKDEKTTIAKQQLAEQQRQAKATEEIAKKFAKGQMVLAMVDNLG